MEKVAEIVLQHGAAPGTVVCALSPLPLQADLLELRVVESDVERLEETPPPSVGPVLVERVHPKDGDLLVARDIPIKQAREIAGFLPKRAGLVLLTGAQTLHDLPDDKLREAGLQRIPEHRSPPPFSPDHVKVLRQAVDYTLKNCAFVTEGEDALLRQADSVLLGMENRSE